MREEREEDIAERGEADVPCCLWRGEVADTARNVLGKFWTQASRNHSRQSA